MLEIENLSREKIDSKSLEQIYETMLARFCAQANGELRLELLLVDSKASKELNRTHRGKDAPTDVLSFPLEVNLHSQAPQTLGSVVINMDLAKEVAHKLGHSTESEVKLLFIHGLLHVFGFDHEVDNGEQRAQEEALIKEFDLPKSLIVRAQEE